MDPVAGRERILNALRGGNLDEAEVALNDLMSWFRSGGFSEGVEPIPLELVPPGPLTNGSVTVNAWLYEQRLKPVPDLGVEFTSAVVMLETVRALFDGTRRRGNTTELMERLVAEPSRLYRGVMGERRRVPFIVVAADERHERDLTQKFGKGRVHVVSLLGCGRSFTGRIGPVVFDSYTVASVANAARLALWSLERKLSDLRTLSKEYDGLRRRMTVMQGQLGRKEYELGEYRRLARSLVLALHDPRKSSVDWEDIEAVTAALRELLPTELPRDGWEVVVPGHLWRREDGCLAESSEEQSVRSVAIDIDVQSPMDEGEE